LQIKVAGQLLYHDVFSMYMHHFVQDDPHSLKDVIQDIISTSSSLPKRCTICPLAQLNSMVSSWTTNIKATTFCSSLVFEDNVGEDGLSSQSKYKVNIDCPYYKASIAPNPKVLNDLKPSEEDFKKVYRVLMKEVNDLRLQIDSKETVSCIDCQGKSFNTNISKVQAKNVVFYPLDGIELVDWTTTNKFSRLWFCKDIHHSYILKQAIKKAIQKSNNWNLTSKLFEDDSNNEHTQFAGLPEAL
jgi:hypothetical protein